MWTVKTQWLPLIPLALHCIASCRRMLSPAGVAACLSTGIWFKLGRSHSQNGSADQIMLLLLNGNATRRLLPDSRA